MKRKKRWQEQAPAQQVNGIWREVPGGITAPEGFQAAGIRCGIKAQGLDLALIYSVAPAAAAGLFTTNRVQAAPVLVTKDRVGRANVHGVIVNSGNANAGTGAQGFRDAVQMTDLTAEALGVPRRSILVCSTGIIGERLPIAKIAAGIPKVVEALRPNGGEQAAGAIMTTDTKLKSIAVEFELDGRPVRIGGMAKGAGMIAPNMATMLCFITTDANITPGILQSFLISAAEGSFHRITVDGDTSTNDTILALANGQSEAGQITQRHGMVRFRQALDHVTKELALAIVHDAEGASKFVEIRVCGAASEKEALKIARTIANSPLVKTALAGSDPNWGRILAAAGRSGVRFDAELLELYLGKVCVFRRGAVWKHDLKTAEAAVAGPKVEITLDLKAGEHETVVWTCDLTESYVRINSAYRT